MWFFFSVICLFIFFAYFSSWLSFFYRFSYWFIPLTNFFVFCLLILYITSALYSLKASFFTLSMVSLGLPWWLSSKESACRCRSYRRCRFSPWVRKIQNSNSWLENPMDRGACRAAVHRVAKSQTWLKQLSTHIHMHGISPFFLKDYQILFFHIWVFNISEFLHIINGIGIKLYTDYVQIPLVD